MATLSASAFILLLITGATAGFLAGLLGIGGGILLVPLFLSIFPLAGFPESTLVHTALATSLAIILPTSVSSTLSHRNHGNVAWEMVTWLAVGGICGAFIGSSAATAVSGDTLKTCFGMLLILVGLKFFIFHPRQPQRSRRAPHPIALAAVGMVGGLISSFFGIGGGVIAVPMMVLLLKLPLHTAVGNSCALIMISSLAGSLFYVTHGWSQPDLPAWSMGFVHVPVAATLSVMTIFTARWGARLASRLPQTGLARGFALLLIGIGGRMVLLTTFYAS